MSTCGRKGPWNGNREERSHHYRRLFRQLGAEERPVAGVVRPCVLRHEVSWFPPPPPSTSPGSVPRSSGPPPPGRPHDRGGDPYEEDGARREEDLRADARAEVGHRLRRVRIERRHIQDLQPSYRAWTRSCLSMSMSPGVPPAGELSRGPHEAAGKDLPESMLDENRKAHHPSGEEGMTAARRDQRKASRG